MNLQGTATGVTLSPLSLAFGSQYVTTSLTKTVTVKGGTTYAATSATLSGDTTDYKIASNTCIGKITTSCVIGVTFNPLSTGVKKATLVIHDSDPTNPQLAGLTGTGTSYESFSVSSHTFPTQVINKASGNFKVTFKYTGPSTLTLNSLVASTNYSVNYTGITSGGCNTVHRCRQPLQRARSTWPLLQRRWARSRERSRRTSRATRRTARWCCR